MKPFISLHNVLPLHSEDTFCLPLNWGINSDEIWTILGDNGTGKSMLADVLQGKQRLRKGNIVYHYFEEIKKKNGRENLWPGKYVRQITFETIQSVTHFKGSYYQQRFNSQDVDRSPLASEIFDLEKPETREAIELLNIDKILERRIISLSNGEQRKLVIAKILSDTPRMIIFDNPFIGLDSGAREQMNKIFPVLNHKGIQLVFLVPSVDKIPSCTTNILEIDERNFITSKKIQEIDNTGSISLSINKLPKINWEKIPQTISAKYDKVVQMDNVEISYGDVLINSDLKWEIKMGEKWALLGPNGSGKSTLLSYIFGDNPQAYAKNLALFDRKRGSGESIWDIKSHIGFISFEMALYYPKNVECINIVESGFHDSIGLYKKSTKEHVKATKHIMEELSLNYLENRRLGEISTGEKQMILFARAVVKNPELLILDEPFNGMDNRNKQKCSSVIDSFCSQSNRTLIFVTHYRDEIPSCVDKLLELKNWRSNS